MCPPRMHSKRHKTQIPQWVFEVSEQTLLELCAAGMEANVLGDVKVDIPQRIDEWCRGTFERLADSKFDTTEALAESIAKSRFPEVAIKRMSPGQHAFLGLCARFRMPIDSRTNHPRWLSRNLPKGKGSRYPRPQSGMVESVRQKAALSPLAELTELRMPTGAPRETTKASKERRRLCQLFAEGGLSVEQYAQKHCDSQMHIVYKLPIIGVKTAAAFLGRSRQRLYEFHHGAHQLGTKTDGQLMFTIDELVHFKLLERPTGVHLEDD